MPIENRSLYRACKYSQRSLFGSYLFCSVLFRFTGNEAFVVPPRTFNHVDVGGRERAKFFRKPLIPFMENIQPLVVLDTSRSPANTFAESTLRTGQGRMMGPAKPNISSGQPATRTQAIQTDYMEREAQTDPYTPEYVVKPGEQPEVLTLATLMYSTWSERE